MAESTAKPGPPARRETHETAVMAVLTVVAGAVDAITFLTMGQVFAALVTGNVLLLSFALAGDNHISVGRSAVALIAFAAGVILAAHSAHRLAERHPFWLPAALTVEALLLGGAGTVALVRYGTGSLAHDPDLLVIMAVALAMGTRAAVVLRAGVPGMPTLLVQRSLVNLLADVDTAKRGGGDSPAGRPRGTRIRPGVTVAAMFLGGILGTLLVPWGTGRALLTIAAGVLLLAGVDVFLSRRPRPRSPRLGT
ncbi:YoaK family protein [Streptomyces sp. NPDC006879]|uniref:YoaK family protein n=1 Tax=Streptomyces sp. NPDC006879 TaxID=3364767 RepID=UPI0036917E9A